MNEDHLQAMRESVVLLALVRDPVARNISSY